MWPVTFDMRCEIRSLENLNREGETKNREPKTDQIISDCRSFPGPRWDRQGCR
jgi:hypothetical protein